MMVQYISTYGISCMGLNRKVWHTNELYTSTISLSPKLTIDGLWYRGTWSISISIFLGEPGRDYRYT